MISTFFFFPATLLSLVLMFIPHVCIARSDGIMTSFTYKADIVAVILGFYLQHYIMNNQLIFLLSCHTQLSEMTDLTCMPTAY